MDRQTILDLSIEDVEKRRIPSKHYVYVIHVSWSDGHVGVIYRRYSRFFDFQSKILDQFPIEAGDDDPRDRIIPFLPGKIIFGRSQTREVALKRMELINEYCKMLIRLPAHISECEELLEFFETTPEDLTPDIEKKKSIKFSASSKISEPIVLDQYTVLADYTKQGKNEIDLKAGQVVEVVEKNETGWWFISTEDSQGWVPSVYLEKEDEDEDARVLRDAKDGGKYIISQTYIPQMEDELRIEKGGVVEVIEKNLDGWWLVRYGDNVGRVPATNLCKTDTLKAKHRLAAEPKKPVEVVTNMMAVSNIHEKKQTQTGSGNSSPILPRSTGVSPKHSAASQVFETKLKTSQPKKPMLPFVSKSDKNNSTNSTPPVSSSRFLRQNSNNRPPPRRNSIVETPPSPRKVMHKKPPRPEPPKFNKIYKTISDFNDKVGDGISFQGGQVVKVLQRTNTGWWLIKINDTEGWAPSNYIQEVKVERQGSANQSPVPRPKLPNPATVRSSQSNGNNTQLETKNSLQPTKSNKPIIDKVDFAAQLQNKLQIKNRANSSSQQPLSPSSVLSSPDSFFDDFDSCDEDDARSYSTVDEPVPVKREYVVTENYTAEGEGEIDLVKGEIVEVTDEAAEGWWYAVSYVKEGWVPASYLDPPSQVQPSNKGDKVPQKAAKPVLPMKPKRLHEQNKGKPPVVSKDKPAILKPKPSIGNRPKLPAKPVCAKKDSGLKKSTESLPDEITEGAKSLKELKSMFNNQ